MPCKRGHMVPLAVGCLLTRKLREMEILLQDRSLKKEDLSCKRGGHYGVSHSHTDTHPWSHAADAVTAAPFQALPPGVHSPTPSLLQLLQSAVLGMGERGREVQEAWRTAEEGGSGRAMELLQLHSCFPLSRQEPPEYPQSSPGGAVCTSRYPLRMPLTPPKGS